MVVHTIQSLPSFKANCSKPPSMGATRPTPPPHSNLKMHTRGVRLFAVLEGFDPEVKLAYTELIAMKCGVG